MKYDGPNHRLISIQKFFECCVMTVVMVVVRPATALRDSNHERPDIRF